MVRNVIKMESTYKNITKHVFKVELQNVLPIPIEFLYMYWYWLISDSFDVNYL